MPENGMSEERLAEIEEALDVLQREGREPAFARELLAEVRRLRDVVRCSPETVATGGAYLQPAIRVLRPPMIAG